MSTPLRTSTVRLTKRASTFLISFAAINTLPDVDPVRRPARWKGSRAQPARLGLSWPVPLELRGCRPRPARGRRRLPRHHGGAGFNRRDARRRRERRHWRGNGCSAPPANRPSPGAGGALSRTWPRRPLKWVRSGRESRRSEPPSFPDPPDHCWSARSATARVCTGPPITATPLTTLTTRFTPFRSASASRAESAERARTTSERPGAAEAGGSAAEVRSTNTSNPNTCAEAAKAGEQEAAAEDMRRNQRVQTHDRSPASSWPDDRHDAPGPEAVLLSSFRKRGVETGLESKLQNASPKWFRSVRAGKAVRSANGVGLGKLFHQQVEHRQSRGVRTLRLVSYRLPLVPRR